MNKRTQRRKKYDSFYDKVKDYQIRKLHMERDSKLKYTADNDYSKEYFALTKARKDIKDRIKENIDAALIFTEIIRMGEFSQGSRKFDPKFQKWLHYPPYNEKKPDQEPRARDDVSDGVKKFVTDLLDKNSDLAKYELAGDEGSIRNEISDESKEFVTNIFNEEIIERLLDAIFFHGYNKAKDNEKHRSYRINVAKKMITKAIYELMDNLDSPYSKFLSQDLIRTVGICNAVGEKPNKEKLGS